MLHSPVDLAVFRQTRPEVSGTANGVDQWLYDNHDGRLVIILGDLDQELEGTVGSAVNGPTPLVTVSWVTKLGESTDVLPHRSSSIHLGLRWQKEFSHGNHRLSFLGEVLDGQARTGQLSISSEVKIFISMMVNSEYSHSFFSTVLLMFDRDIHQGEHPWCVARFLQLLLEESMAADVALAIAYHGNAHLLGNASPIILAAPALSLRLAFPGEHTPWGLPIPECTSTLCGGETHVCNWVTLKESKNKKKKSQRETECVKLRCKKCNTRIAVEKPDWVQSNLAFFSFPYTRPDVTYISYEK